MKLLSRDIKMIVRKPEINELENRIFTLVNASSSQQMRDQGFKLKVTEQGRSWINITIPHLGLGIAIGGGSKKTVEIELNEKN